MKECTYCELGIHGNCIRNQDTTDNACDCECKGSKDYWMRLENEEK